MDKESVKKIFELSRIKFEESSEIEKDFLKIVKWVEKIKELNVDDVEVPDFFKSKTPQRRDEPFVFKNISKIKENFPECRDDFLLVPEVIKK